MRFYTYTRIYNIYYINIDTLLVEVGFKDGVDAGDENVGANVELPFVIEKRRGDILLDDDSLLIFRIEIGFEIVLNLVECVEQLYIVASVGVLAGLADPPIVSEVESVGSELLLEEEVLRVVALGDVESERQKRKDILIVLFQEESEVGEQVFLVVQYLVVLQVVVHLILVEFANHSKVELIIHIVSRDCLVVQTLQILDDWLHHQKVIVIQKLAYLILLICITIDIYNMVIPV